MPLDGQPKSLVRKNIAVFAPSHLHPGLLGPRYGVFIVERDPT